MKLSILTLFLVSVSAQAASALSCESDLFSPRGPKVQITLEGPVSPETPSQMDVFIRERDTGRVLFQHSYSLEQVADYKKGGAYRFQVNPEIVGIADYFSGRGSLYVNIPTVFTGIFKLNTDCHRS